LVLVVIGCGKQAAETPAGPKAGAAGGTITLTVWDWHSSDPSKGVGLWLSKIDKEFEAAHPGVKINHVGQPHTEYYELLKAAASAASKNGGPDVVMLHQGNRVLENRGSLRPLTEYVTPEFRKKILGWELTSDDFDAAKTPWAVSIAVQGLVWYYNKALLKQAGLDPNKPPATWDQFLAACAAVKKIGKAGIAVGEKEGFWAAWFASSAYFQTFGPGDLQRLRSGEMKWNDPKIGAIFDKLKDLNDKGCFQEGFMSTPLFPDAGEVFQRGDAAFFLGLISDVAHWKELGEMIGPENLGVMTCPVFKAGPDAQKFPIGGAFAYAITKWSPHPKEAWDYIAFVANDEHAGSFLSECGSFPANQSYDRKLITDPTAKIIAKWISDGRGGRHLLDEMPTSITDTLQRECQRLLTGQTDVAGALAALAKPVAGAGK
jgi:ABC-type glycerol-3-phosphate transport system substrate-binding protein